MKAVRDRVIIDTNLWVSFLLTKDYLRLDTLFESNHILLLFSDELIEEFVDVCQRTKFKKYFTSADLKSLLQLMRARGEFIHVTSKVEICRDPKDDFLLALASDGYATHLVTGDKICWK